MAQRPGDRGHRHDPVDHLPGDAAAVRVLPVAADEDDDIERALGIPSGRLQMTRARDGVILRQLRDERLAPVGFACFDPAFPARSRSA